ncbi:hypothetical protein J3A83DRAFT_4217685 [Scleroderma citrinum]
MTIQCRTGNLLLELRACTSAPIFDSTYRKLTFGGYDASVITGSVPITSKSTPIVDGGTTCILLANNAFMKHKYATSATVESVKGLLAITQSEYNNLFVLYTGDNQLCLHSHNLFLRIEDSSFSLPLCLVSAFTPSITLQICVLTFTRTAQTHERLSDGYCGDQCHCELFFHTLVTISFVVLLWSYNRIH